MTMGWRDTEDIGIALSEKFPDIDPLDHWTDEGGSCWDAMPVVRRPHQAGMPTHEVGPRPKD